MEREPGFLNVDLEVGARSRGRLAPLIEAMDGQLVELFHGRIRSLYRVHYEILPQKRDASATIHALAAVLEALPAPARRAWQAATWRDFNVGVELAKGVRMLEIAIEPAAVRRVAALGGRIVFTAYQVAAMRQGRLKARRRADA